YDYEPYGTSTSETRLTASAPANPVRFAGQNLDATGLYHLHAREYEPATGRFLTTDPLPQALSDPYVSAYAYVAGRPTAWLDPSGLRWCWKACPVTDFVTEHHREVLAVGTVAACGFVTAGTCLAVALAAA